MFILHDGFIYGDRFIKSTTNATYLINVKASQFEVKECQRISIKFLQFNESKENTQLGCCYSRRAWFVYGCCWWSQYKLLWQPWFWRKKSSKRASFFAKAGFSCLVVESDNLQLISLLKDNSSSPAVAIGLILDDICCCICMFSFISFNFVRRHVNLVAHFLAKRGLDFSSDLYWLENHPSFLIDFLIANSA